VTHAKVRVRRIYDEPSAADGNRVLVDRIWPRGVSKARAHLDDWCKQIAPSNELRKGGITTIQPGSQSPAVATVTSSPTASSRPRLITCVITCAHWPNTTP
jgi:hypothetical protein